MASNLPPPFVGFWSMKGGVGRSLLLANFAAYLAERGKKVLVVDLDTEAPTLEYVFGTGPGQRSGAKLLDTHCLHFLVPGVRHGGMYPTVERLSGALVDVYKEILNHDLKPELTALTPEEQAQIKKGVKAHRRAHGGKGPIWLLPARYDRELLSKLSYTDSTLVQHFGTALLRFAINNNLDYILLDLRSGVSDAAAWFLDELATMVFVTTASVQSILGTLQGVDDFTRFKNRRWDALPAAIINRVPAQDLYAPLVQYFQSQLEIRFPTRRSDKLAKQTIPGVAMLGIRDALWWLIDGELRATLETAFDSILSALENVNR